MRSAALVVLLGLPVLAQERLEIEGPAPATVRLGDTADVTIRVVGRGANPNRPAPPAVDGLEMGLVGPMSSQQMRVVNGQVSTTVSVEYTLRLRPTREGQFVVPAFALRTGTREQTVHELRLTAVKDLRGGDLGFIDMEVEPRRVYVHEPIRVRARFGIDPGFRLAEGFADRRRYLDIEVQSQWFDELPGAEPIAVSEPRGDVRWVVVNGRGPFAATFDGSHVRDGKTWQSFAIERAFLPTRIGRIELPAPTLRYDVLRSNSRAFGRTASENLYTYGEPVSLEVLPIPEKGRPTPYYGAVGRFTLDAALDRDTVTVGNSVKLQLTVRGQGNLEFLRLPELDDLAGFHKLGAAEARRDAEKVVVTYDLTPLSADVREVPAIHWNYFDTTPGVEKFVETATRPLPLRVEPLPVGETLAALPNNAAKPVTPGVDDIFDLPDFDGAPARAIAHPAWLGWLAALGPWLLVAGALAGFAGLRRRRADVTGQRARNARRSCRATLAAGGEPVDALATYLGDRLAVPAAAAFRPSLGADLERAGVDADLAAEVAAAIQRGTEARYGGGDRLTAAEVEDLVDRLEPARIDRTQWAALALLLALAPFALTAPLGAQAAAPSGRGAAIAAYRAGDYAAADALFAEAYEATGDRRLLRARGNCLFRLGELPRALWAFESARLGAPRDAELRADIALVQRRLEVGDDAGGFLAELGRLRRRLSPVERTLLLAACMFVAALCLIGGWRRVGWRWVGALALLPGLWLAAEVLWLDAVRPPRAVALEKLAITSEPRAGLEPVATARPGVEVDVLGGTDGTFVRIAAGDRTGYVPRAAIAVVR